MAGYGDDSIIPRKLLFDGDGTGEDKKLQFLIKTLYTWAAKENDPQTDQDVFMKLQGLLFDMKLRKKQRDLARKCTQTQIDKFQNTYKIFEDKVKEINGDIEHQQGLVKRAQLVKQHFVECEFLVKAINQEPSRHDLERDIKRLREEIGELKREKNILDDKWNARIKQCQVLSTSANALRSILKDEEVSSDEEVASGNINKLD
ncbi:THO complex subunit 7 homolog [Anthonomus grandis grandis]|uniref:THO complex subunit 7 homolog n=1 Tax=Anthonomus grandis grandis TaxID=2921223 RepID=UPI002166BA1A|nr:THO complex subunit 7 homolog [Anthonomus grandis grandis]